MNEELRYNENLTMTEYRVATCDELALERIVFETICPETPLQRRFYDADKAALREIDRLKSANNYEAERARLACFLEPSKQGRKKLSTFLKTFNFETVQNLLDGLQSPDTEQRARFTRLYDEAELADRSPREIEHILLCLEKAKKPKGRPSVSPPWGNVWQALDAMRPHVASGSTIPQAAKEVAAKEGDAMVESRAHRYEKLYRERLALRK